MAVTATQGPLTGLPRRLVQDGVISEADLMAALNAIEGKSANLVPHLVANRLGDPRQIAIAAAHEFGVPLLDLDAVDLDLDVVKLVDEKLLLKHRILPILQRGKRLFIAVCDPTNLQALDEIKFQTTLRIEAIVVEQDKLDARVARAIEAVDTTMSNLGDDDGFDLENLEVTGGDEEVGRRRLDAPTSTMRRSCGSSTKSWSTPSRRARPTSTSSPTKSTSAFACARTACSRRSHARRSRLR